MNEALYSITAKLVPCYLVLSLAFGWDVRSLIATALTK
jgi:hypothetical protein